MIALPLARRLTLLGLVALVFSLGTVHPLFLAPPLRAEFSEGTDPNTDSETGKPIVTTPSGLRYVDLVVGSGATPKRGDSLTVNYVGMLTNGKVFDSSAQHGQPMTYIQGVTQLIAGWTEGTSTMKVGGKRKLIIPPYLGYGLQGQGDVIPPSATLIFQIELLKIDSTPAGPAPGTNPAHP